MIFSSDVSDILFNGDSLFILIITAGPGIPISTIYDNRYNKGTFYDIYLFA